MKLSIGFIVAFLILLNCSGLKFPIINGRADLDNELVRYGVHLPASALIEESERVAYRDPEHRFKVKMSAADAASLFTTLQTTAARGKFRMSPLTERWLNPVYPRPVWWRPEDFSDPVGIEITDERGDLRAVYSPSTGLALFCWGRF